MRLHFTPHWFLSATMLITAFAAPTSVPAHHIFVAVNPSAGRVDDIMKQGDELAQLEKFIDSILPSLLENELKNISFQKSYSMSLKTSFENPQSIAPTHSLKMPSYSVRRTRELSLAKNPMITTASRNSAPQSIYFIPSNSSLEWNKRLESIVPSGVEDEKLNRLLRKSLTKSKTAAAAMDEMLALTTSRPSVNEHSAFLDNIRASFASNHALYSQNIRTEFPAQGEYVATETRWDAFERDLRNRKVDDQDKRQLKTLKMQGYFPGAVTEIKDMSDADLIALLKHYFRENKGQSDILGKYKDEPMDSLQDVEKVTFRTPDSQPNKQLTGQQKVRYGYRAKPKSENDYQHHEQNSPEISNKYVPRIYPKPTAKINEINEKDPLVKFITVIVSEVIKTLQAKNALDRLVTSTEFYDLQDLFKTTVPASNGIYFRGGKFQMEKQKTDEEICDQRMKALVPELSRILYEKLSTQEGIQEFSRQRSKISLQRIKNFPPIKKPCMRRFEDYMDLLTDVAVERLKNRNEPLQKHEVKEHIDSLDRQEKHASVAVEKNLFYPNHIQSFRDYDHQNSGETLDDTMVHHKVQKDYKTDEDYKYIIPNLWPNKIYPNQQQNSYEKEYQSF